VLQGVDGVALHDIVGGRDFFECVGLGAVAGHEVVGGARMEVEVFEGGELQSYCVGLCHKIL
jgi:hypothetical protein